MNVIKEWIKDGSPWVWLNAGAVAISLLMVLGVMSLIVVRGAVHFWPADVIKAQYRTLQNSAEIVIGEIQETESVPASRIRASGIDVPDDVDVVTRYLLKTGNRDLTGIDFKWVFVDRLSSIEAPPLLTVIERREWGNFYGFIRAVKENGTEISSQIGSQMGSGNESWSIFQTELEKSANLFDRIKKIEQSAIGKINYQLEQLRLRERRLQLESKNSEKNLAEITERRTELDAKYQTLQEDLIKLHQQAKKTTVVVESANNSLTEIPLIKIVQAYQPNSMSVFEKFGFYIHQLWLFLSDEPREANTEGGVFPAIFGTVLMVILMSVLVTPFGVVAAVYMREYAKQGVVTRLVRIAVNNLAGVPSIVYGVFGLGFFVYFLGGSIDDLLYPEAAPAPVFGTPGLMWASITLALLTVPVVIVATEEGLTRIPKAIREGSLALGATKFETLWKVVLPMSSPAMMTGLILAVARAAGEVAPLMLVGVVKLAPTLPLDANAPFLHLERKFMHLGFHIYDVGFQSPNVEAARPLVYATAFLLVAVIAALNLTAITIRNRLRERYRGLEM